MTEDQLRERALMSIKKPKYSQQNILNVMEELSKITQVANFYQIIQTPKQQQYAYLVKNPKILSLVREQIFFLLSNNIDWTQIEMLGLDHSVKIAFQAEFPQFLSANPVGFPSSSDSSLRNKIESDTRVQPSKAFINPSRASLMSSNNSNSRPNSPAQNAQTARHNQAPRPNAPAHFSPVTPLIRNNMQSLPSMGAQNNQKARPNTPTQNNQQSRPNNQQSRPNNHQANTNSQQSRANIPVQKVQLPRPNTARNMQQARPNASTQNNNPSRPIIPHNIQKSQPTTFAQRNQNPKPFTTTQNSYPTRPNTPIQNNQQSRPNNQHSKPNAPVQSAKGKPQAQKNQTFRPKMPAQNRPGQNGVNSQTARFSNQNSRSSTPTQNASNSQTARFNQLSRPSIPVSIKQAFGPNQNGAPRKTPLARDNQPLQSNPLTQNEISPQTTRYDVLTRPSAPARNAQPSLVAPPVRNNQLLQSNPLTQTDLSPQTTRYNVLTRPSAPARNAQPSLVTPPARTNSISGPKAPSQNAQASSNTPPAHIQPTRITPPMRDTLPSRKTPPMRNSLPSRTTPPMRNSVPEFSTTSVHTNLSYFSSPPTRSSVPLRSRDEINGRLGYNEKTVVYQRAGQSRSESFEDSPKPQAVLSSQILAMDAKMAILKKRIENETLRRNQTVSLVNEKVENVIIEYNKEENSLIECDIEIPIIHYQRPISMINGPGENLMVEGQDGGLSLSSRIELFHQNDLMRKVTFLENSIKEKELRIKLSRSSLSDRKKKIKEANEQSDLIRQNGGISEERIVQLNTIGATYKTELGSVLLQLEALEMKKKLIESNMTRVSKESEQNILSRTIWQTELSETEAKCITLSHSINTEEKNLATSAEELKMNLSEFTVKRKFLDSMIPIESGRKRMKTSTEYQFRNLLPSREYHFPVEFFNEFINDFWQVESDLVGIQDVASFSLSLDCKETIVDFIKKRMSNGVLCSREVESQACKDEYCQDVHFIDFNCDDDQLLVAFVLKNLRSFCPDQIHRLKTLKERIHTGPFADYLLNNPTILECLASLMNPSRIITPLPPVPSPLFLTMAFYAQKNMHNINSERPATNAYEDSLKTDQLNISLWVSYGISLLPPPPLQGSENLHPAISVFRRALTLNGRSEILWTWILELYIQSSVTVETAVERESNVRKMYLKATRLVVNKAPLLWHQYHFESTFDAKIKILLLLVSETCKKRESLAIVNCLIQLMKMTLSRPQNSREIGFFYSICRGSVDEDTTGILSILPTGQSIRQKLLPSHLAFFTLSLVCYLSLGQLPSNLFCKFPHSHLVIAKPFLIPWKYVISDDFNWDCDSAIVAVIEYLATRSDEDIHLPLVALIRNRLSFLEWKLKISPDLLLNLIEEYSTLHPYPEMKDMKARQMANSNRIAEAFKMAEEEMNNPPFWNTGLMLCVAGKNQGAMKTWLRNGEKNELEMSTFDLFYPLLFKCVKKTEIMKSEEFLDEIHLAAVKCINLAGQSFISHQLLRSKTQGLLDFVPEELQAWKNSIESMTSDVAYPFLKYSHLAVRITTPRADTLSDYAGIVRHQVSVLQARFSENSVL